MLKNNNKNNNKNMNVNNMFYRLEKINFINEHLDNDELTKIVERLEKKNGKKLYDNQKNRLRPVSNSVKDNTQKDVSEILREYIKFDKSINAHKSTDKPGNSDLKKNSDANSRLRCHDHCLRRHTTCLHNHSINI